MSYRRAEEILPLEIIEMIQQYVEGESIYIPRKPGQRAAWGSNSHIRQEISSRNRCIYEDYVAGLPVYELAEKYFLSEKSIQRIIRQMR